MLNESSTSLLISVSVDFSDNEESSYYLKSLIRVVESVRFSAKILRRYSVYLRRNVAIKTILMVVTLPKKSTLCSLLQNTSWFSCTLYPEPKPKWKKGRLPRLYACPFLNTTSSKMNHRLFLKQNGQWSQGPATRWKVSYSFGYE